MPATTAYRIVKGADIARAIPEQGHTFHTQRCYGDLAILTGFQHITMLVEYLQYNKIWLLVAAHASAAFGKGRLHFGRCVCAIELYWPVLK